MSKGQKPFHCAGISDWPSVHGAALPSTDGPLSPVKKRRAPTINTVAETTLATEMTATQIQMPRMILNS